MRRPASQVGGARDGSARKRRRTHAAAPIEAFAPRVVHHRRRGARGGSHTRGERGVEARGGGEKREHRRDLVRSPIPGRRRHKHAARQQLSAFAAAAMSHGGGIQERIPSRPGSTPASPGVQERIGALRIGGGAVGSPRPAASSPLHRALGTSASPAVARNANYTPAPSLVTDGGGTVQGLFDDFLFVAENRAAKLSAAGSTRRKNTRTAGESGNDRLQSRRALHWPASTA